MTILGIETSCDDCCVALVKDGKHILAETQASQQSIHGKFNGVVPEFASRSHLAHITPLVKQVLADAGFAIKKVDGIAVTAFPGLHSSLLIGVSFAKALAYAASVPCVTVNHLLAHLYAAQLAYDIAYPHIGLIVSGGHTQLGVVHSYDNFEIFGSTIDDACGEAFDKVAVHLGLGYPGGIEIDALARRGSWKSARFPDSKLKHRSQYDLSYSGLKSAVIHQLRLFWNNAYPYSIVNIAAAFQKKAIDMLLTRIATLVQETGLHVVVGGGGVLANSYLRHALQNSPHYSAVIPPHALCTDNASMIAGVGYRYLQR